MDLDIPDRLIPVRDKIDQFVKERVDPLTEEYYDEIDVGDRWQLTDRQNEIMDGLKAQAKEAGLWNFFLPTSQGGAGVSNLEYAHLAEVMARNPIASEVFNCAAPDTGNMEVLERYGSEAQKKEWLEPLLEGKIRSAFAMTEPGVASSDATNICTSAVLDGDEWLINGEKHYISGAGDPRCKIMITMVITNPDAPKHLRQSQILVPIDAAGVTVLRPMYVFGKDDDKYKVVRWETTDGDSDINNYYKKVSDLRFKFHFVMEKEITVTYFGITDIFLMCFDDKIWHSFSFKMNVLLKILFLLS